MYVVIVQTQGDILVPEERKTSTEVGHAASFGHACYWSIGQCFRILQVKVAKAKHQFKVLVGRIVNARARIIILVVCWVDDDATCRDIETICVVALLFVAAYMRPIVLATKLVVVPNTLELGCELVFPARIGNINSSGSALVYYR